MKPKKVSLVSSNDLKIARRRINKLLGQKYQGLDSDLLHIVKHLLAKRGKFLKLAKKYQTPFYVLDEEELKKGLTLFSRAFNQYLPGSEFYYSMKVNHHPDIIKNVLKHSFHLDVSSERELKIALACGAKKILFTGPAKEISGLELAVKNNKKVIVNIDSFQELERLAKITQKRKQTIRAGVRIFGKYQGTWNKFGIPLNELYAFWQKARDYPLIKLDGIHTHMSWNKDALSYENVITEIADYLKKNFSQNDLREIKFFDFGGGFRPYRSEGYYPWNTPQGKLIKTANDYFGQKTTFNQRYFIVEGATIPEYAKGIAHAINKHLRPLITCVYYTEPGRAICNNAMHVVIRIDDVKSGNIIIADGGINIVGWERFEYDYFPLINLSNPSLKEMSSLIYGSLCLPEDIWGYYCYAK